MEWQARGMVGDLSHRGTLRIADASPQPRFAKVVVDGAVQIHFSPLHEDHQSR